MMRVLALQLTANAKPLLNNFINTTLKQHQDFEMNLVNKGTAIEVVHKEKGSFVIPMSSVSWFRPAPKGSAVVAPLIKKRRGRPKKELVKAYEEATKETAPVEV